MVGKGPMASSETAEFERINFKKAVRQLGGDAGFRDACSPLRVGGVTGTRALPGKRREGGAHSEASRAKAKTLTPKTGAPPALTAC